MTERSGCYYCFHALDPHDNDKALQSFVSCQQCGRLYHEPCWSASDECAFCHDGGVEPAQIAPLLSLKAQSKIQAISIKPSAVFYSWNGEMIEVSTDKRDIGLVAQVLDRLMQSILLAAILIALAAFLGAYSNSLLPLSQWGELDAGAALQVLAESPFPAKRTLIVTLIAGSIAALVFYQPFQAEHSVSEQQLSLGTWVLAGLITLLLADLILLNLSLSELMELEATLNAYGDWLFLQGVTVLLVILLIPLYKRLAPSIPRLDIVRSPPVKELFGWVRFLLVSLLLVGAVVYLVTEVLLSYPERNWVWDRSIVGREIEIDPLIVASFLLAITGSIFFYRAPAFRRLRQPYGILRLSLFFFCILAFGFVWYNFPDYSEQLLMQGGITLGLIILLVPLQRVLS